MISIARTTQRNVKNSKDAAMDRRWTAAGMLAAQTKFRRIKGHRDMRCWSQPWPETPAQVNPKPSEPPPNTGRTVTQIQQGTGHPSGRCSS